MIWLYNTILYTPIYNLLIFLYNIIPGQEIGLAIIALTIIIKLVLLPLSWQAVKGQKAMQDLQPKMTEIKRKFKDQKDKQAQEIMKLYKENKVNPLSSCFPLLIQFPFLIAVYQVFRIGLNNSGFDLLYPFVQNPGNIDPWFFGFLDLSVASIPLAVLAGIGQYISAKMLMPKKVPQEVKKDGIVKKGAKDENLMAEMSKSMLYFMPFITVIIGSQLPGGLMLYWLLTTILQIIQQKVLFRKTGKPKAGPDEKGKVIEAVSDIV